jgi:hypothetical protein
LNIEAIINELKSERERIDKVIGLLEGSSSGTSAVRRKAAAPASKPVKHTSHISAAGRKKISDMMKKRWAERRRQKAGSR